MHGHRRPRWWKLSRGLLVATVLLSPAIARGLPAGSPTACEALALCVAADQAPAALRALLLDEGLARAEAAVESAPRDATAHFAVFCNLGKHLQGLRSSWRLWSVLGEIRRARDEINTALALAPDYAEALAPKGEMLAELLRVLGGDVREAERLLRLALALDPSDGHIRAMLSKLPGAPAARHDAVWSDLESP